MFLDYVEHPKNGLHGLGFELTIKRSSDDIVLGHAFALGVAIGANQVAIDVANDSKIEGTKNIDISL